MLQILRQSQEDDDSDEAEEAFDEAFHKLSSIPAWQPLMEVQT